jgi:hypothetical protein
MQGARSSTPILRMKSRRRTSILPGVFRVLCMAGFAGPILASDHADPMNILNPFEVQKDGEANITDLHVFVVDKDWKPITRKPSVEQGDQLIVSLCVRRALTEQRDNMPLRPSDASALKLDGYTFRIHIDFNPPVRFFDEAAHEQKLKELAGDAKALAEYLALTNDERAAQFRYGGVIDRPADIADEGGLEFQLHYNPGTGRPGTDDAEIAKAEMTGGWMGQRRFNIVKPGEKPVPGRVSVRAGIFDDPFIFPRFFRRNVVGIVSAIPLDRLPPVAVHASPSRPIFVWATTHGKDGRQIDHVGRSLRTQVPRFGHLNTLHPAQHRAAIQRVYKSPTLLEDGFSTFVGPLFAHRHYDDVPDVMIYDLNRPAKFPNGRALTDDVARALAEGGETLLFELSYAESEQFPRATENDKPFEAEFPFLAKRWTNTEIAAARAGAFDTRADGSKRPVPFDALAEVREMPSFTEATEKKLWALALFAVFAVLAVLGGILRLGYYLGRQRGLADAGKANDEGQGLVPGEEQVGGSSFAEVHAAVIDPATCRPYRLPTDSPNKELPRHEVSFWKVATGLLPWGKPSLIKRAIRRTLRSRNDLRWGEKGEGVQRLIHPNGICLAGKWIIEGQRAADGTFGPTGYSGYFEKGKEGLIIARMSPSRSETRRGHWRSHGLTAKIYPTTDRADRSVKESASFFTQEDLGGTRATHINDMTFLNGPDLHAWRRGKGVFTLILTGFFFARINTNAVVRQLHEIAELHGPNDPAVVNTKCPTFMRLKVVGDRRTPGESLDVREEVLDHIYDKGDPTPKRALVLSIEVSDHDQDVPRAGLLDPLIRRKIPETSWKRIGRIEFTEAMCSRNGDFVIHFHHPLWRENPSDPKTQVKVK